MKDAVESPFKELAKEQLSITMFSIRIYDFISIVTSCKIEHTTDGRCNKANLQNGISKLMRRHIFVMESHDKYQHALDYFCVLGYRVPILSIRCLVD